jgi:hypothetical protein
MRPLFISQVCDYCDGLDCDDGDWDLGWVVWRGRPMPTDEYVFATREDAARWKRAQGMTSEPILAVRAPIKFRWRKSTGAVKDVTTADRLVTIFPDRRFPAGPNRAYLADPPTDRSPSCP